MQPLRQPHQLHGPCSGACNNPDRRCGGRNIVSINMGYIKHHAIVVTRWNDKHIERAHGLAIENSLSPTDITPSVVNGYRSFMIPPDGSKEGWEESNLGDERRSAWVNAMKDLGEDDYCEWAELAFRDDDGMARVTRHAFPEC